MKKVFINTINYNTKKETVNCLMSIQKLDRVGIELSVLVIDNGTEPFDIDENAFEDIGLSIIKTKSNLGFSGGHNLGIKTVLKRGADFILILNNDTILEKNILIELLKPFKELNIGMTVPKMYFAPGFEFHKNRYKKGQIGKVLWYAGGDIDWENVYSKHRGVDEVDNGQYDNTEETVFASGACLMVKREVFEKVGVFDHRYFMYFEDADFNVRIRKAGYRVLYVPKAVLWHVNAASSGSGSSLHDYFITRNRMLFGLKFAPLRAKFALFREGINLLFSGRKWQKKGIRDFYLRRFGKGSFK